MLISHFNNGTRANTTQNKKNNKIIDGFGLIRCLRNMVFYIIIVKFASLNKK